MSRGVTIPTMVWERSPDVPLADEPTLSDPTITAFITKLLCAHGGRLAVSEIQQHLSLPPAHVVGLLREESSRFLLLEQAGVVLVLSSVRLCKNYLREKCQARDCVRLHLCHVFILGQCFHRSKGNTCEFSHNVQSEVNMAVLKANNISNLDERELQVLLLLNDPSFLPEVCMDYKGQRTEESCQSGVWCKNLHICGLFTRGECRHYHCKRSHNLLDLNILRVMEARGLSKEICQNIQLMRHHQCKMARKEPRIKNTKGHSRLSRDRSTSQGGRRRCESNERVPVHHLRHFSTTTTASHEVLPEIASPLAMFIQRSTPVEGADVRSFSAHTAATAASTAHTARTPITTFPQTKTSVAEASVGYSVPQPPAATTKNSTRETQPNMLRMLVDHVPLLATASKTETLILGARQTNRAMIEASVGYSSPLLSPASACLQPTKDAQPTISPVPLDLSPPPTSTFTAKTAPTSLTWAPQTNKAASYLPYLPLTATSTANPATLPMNKGLQTNKAVVGASTVSSSLPLLPIAAVKLPIGVEHKNTSLMNVGLSPLQNDKSTAYTAAAPIYDPPWKEILAQKTAALLTTPPQRQKLANQAAAPLTDPPLKEIVPQKTAALLTTPPQRQKLANQAAAPLTDTLLKEILAQKTAALFTTPPHRQKLANQAAASLSNPPQRQTLVVHPVQSHSTTPTTPICKTHQRSSVCTEVQNPNTEGLGSSVHYSFPSPPAPAITYSSGEGQQKRSHVVFGISPPLAATSSAHPTSLTGALQRLTTAVQQPVGQPSSPTTAASKSLSVCTVVQQPSKAVDALVAMNAPKVEMPAPYRNLSTSSSLDTLPTDVGSRPYDLQHKISSDASSQNDRGDLNEICIYHIWKFCKKRQQCTQMHYHLPYRWQIFDGIGHWNDLSSMAEIEKAYSDPNNTSTKRHNIDFQKMTSLLNRVRRLSTCSSVTKSPDHIFTTEWVWYWKNESGQWIEYGKHGGNETATFTSTDIESIYLADKRAVVQINTGRQLHEINFQDMSYRNMVNGTKKDVLRRPKFISQDEVFNLRTSGKRTQDMTENSAIPAHWDQTALPSVGFQLVDVYSGSSEFKEIQREFEKTMAGFSIQKMKRVQNPSLWQAYQMQLKKMKTVNMKKDVLERKLFQGVAFYQVGLICYDSFTAAYGQGSCFSRDASCSHLTCLNGASSTMFLASVLVGDCEKRPGIYSCPPTKPTCPGKAYDICVDNEEDPSIFFVFEKHQVYPDYVLEYTEDKVHRSAPDFAQAKVQDLTQNKVQDYAWSNLPTRSHTQAKDKKCCVS